MSTVDNNGSTHSLYDSSRKKTRIENQTPSSAENSTEQKNIH